MPCHTNTELDLSRGLAYTAANSLSRESKLVINHMIIEIWSGTAFLGMFFATQSFNYMPVN